MQYIIKETPEGVIDWVNKVFTFSSEIKEFDDLWLDGAIYNDFVIDWKNIILVDAPKSSIFWDYYSFWDISSKHTKYIAKEQPRGDINHKNKIFTLKNDVYKVDDLWLDWAIYNNYTVDKNILTLEDAPMVSLYIDYYTLLWRRNINTGITFKDIKKELLRLIWQKESSKNFQDEYISGKINSVANDIWNWHVTNLLDSKDIIKAGNMSFQNAFVSFNVRQWAISSSDVNIWDTSITASIKDMDEYWWAMFWVDIIKYAKSFDKKLSWVSWISVDHKAGTKIVALYELPDDFSKWISVKKIVNDASGIKEIDIPFWIGNSSYEILTDSNSWKKLLKLNWLNSWDIVKFYYVLSYPMMYNDNDLCPFPDSYWLSVLALLAAGMIAQENTMPMSWVLLSMAYPNLKTMYSYFSSDLKKTKQKLLPKVYSFESIR